MNKGGASSTEDSDGQSLWARLGGDNIKMTVQRMVRDTATYRRRSEPLVVVSCRVQRCRSSRPLHAVSALVD